MNADSQSGKGGAVWKGVGRMTLNSCCDEVTVDSVWVLPFRLTAIVRDF